MVLHTDFHVHNSLCAQIDGSALVVVMHTYALALLLTYNI